MNRRSPARTARLFRGEAREVEPTLVEKVAETVWASGPGKHRNRIDDRAQIALSRPQGLFSPLPIVNIDQQDIPAGDTAIRIAYRLRARLEPSIDAISPAAAVFNVAGISGCDRVRKGRDHPGKVIRMRRLAGRPALQFLRCFAEVIQQRAIEKLNFASRAHGTEEPRNAVHNPAKVVFSFCA